ncbi:trypsin-like peptidase domain-containing protein [Rhodococcus sp. D2-41]|uniref:S1 family peptidase n=2 Tax=Speluncibacter jeojiensis TaxID=2710754 RepID=A0A9X4RGI5_9ACTN|nr:serine protease [Rhodococcus sp. D2-41]MDG3011083.1 trypsin-like peptidase domain-containing protein [Rhodococcus sp. D2-41]MDG3014061.1 S1 family peptidase [Corynebacteriales bacterium D3-21]
MTVVAAAAVAATVGVMPANAAPAKAVLGGGSGIIINGDVACTLTTIGHDAQNNLVGITAGHCGDPGAKVVPEFDAAAGVVGTFVKSDPNLDYAVIQFDPNKVLPVDRIGGLTISRIGAPANFPNIACKEGRTTGNTCGITWMTDLPDNATWTQICVMEGDSGSPVVVGNTLVGMVNAYLELPCVGPEVGTTMQSIMADVNKNPAPGGVGRGFVPVP